jgi:hypothetical protein
MPSKHWNSQRIVSRVVGRRSWSGTLCCATAKRARVHLGEPVDEQAQHHNENRRHDALRLLDED